MKIIRGLVELKVPSALSMNRSLLRVSVLLLFLFPSVSKAQDLVALEDSVAKWHGILAGSSNDELRTQASEKMRGFLSEAFTMEGVFEFPFDKLKFCTLTSIDKKIRLFNWNQPFDNGNSKYFCFVLEWNEKKQLLSVTELIDTQKEIEKVDQKFLTPEKWLGTLYYDIIPMERSKSNDTYTLLGWQSKDHLTTKKVIDAMTVKNGKVRVGAPIFKTDMDTYKRMIFEYSEDASMSVKYYWKKKHIVMDHLSPLQPMMTGIYSEYGPDGTYDRFVLDKGKWVLQKEVDVSIYGSDENRPYADPRRKR